MKRLKTKRQSIRKNKIQKDSRYDWYEKIFYSRQDPLGLAGMMPPDDVDILRQYTQLVNDPVRLALASQRLQQEQQEIQSLLGLIANQTTSDSDNNHTIKS